MLVDPTLWASDTEEIFTEIRHNLANRAEPVSGAIHFYPIPQIDFRAAEQEYLASNPDVADTIGRGACPSVWDHWLFSGMNEGRRSPLYGEEHPLRQPGDGAPASEMSGSTHHVISGSHLTRLKLLAANLQGRCSSLDDMPVSPRTPRARLGRLLLGVVRRILWWQRRQWDSLAEAIGKYVGEQTFMTMKLADAHLDTQRALDMLTRKLDEFRAETGARIADLASPERMAALESKLAAISDQLIVLNRSWDAAEDRLKMALSEARSAFPRDIPGLSGQSYAHPARITEASRSGGNLKACLPEGNEDLRRTAQADATQSLSVEPRLAGDRDFEALYFAFEEFFRGPRAEIKQRLNIFIPILRTAGIGTAGSPVLDLGSGRGEWLEILRENDLIGFGIDSNRVMLDLCRSLMLPVTEADALGYLYGLEGNSVGAVTAFHLVEHLPFPKVIELLDQALRVLKPNGLLILETPNPGNVLVGSCAFYLDPTHHKPLPSAMLKFFVEARGFTSCRIIELERNTTSPQFPPSGSGNLGESFCGPQDYAVIAQKP